MQKTAVRYLTLLSFVGGFFFTSSSELFAQGVVSGGMRGLVRDNAGKFVSSAIVKATPLPTGTSYTAVTGPSGRDNFSGMIVGGPYTVSADAAGYKPAERTDISTQLGTRIASSFSRRLITNFHGVASSLTHGF